MARGPNGKSGWLGFLIFQLVATPLFYLGREAGPIYELEREGLKFPDGFKFMYFGSIVVTGALLFYAGYLLWSGKTRQDALDALKFMWGGLTAMIAAPAWVFSSHFPDISFGGDLVMPVMVAVFWGTVWTIYIFTSRRVRNTYAPARATTINSSSSNGAYTESSANVDLASADEKRAATNPPESLSEQIEVAQGDDSGGGLRFTMFRANADGKWYWVLGQIAPARIIARGVSHESRSACLADIQLIRASAGGVQTWDKTANEYVD